MDFMATIRIALRALNRNKMRSILTMLGIIIGVGAVIAMVGVGQGAQQVMQEQIQAMGSNLLFVGSGTVNRGGMRMGWGATKSLVEDDMKAILQEVPTVQAAAPGDGTGAQVVFGNDNWSTRITGTTPSYFDIRNWPTAEGTVFTQSDEDTAANVAVIGETVRKNLFGATDPIGQTIRINNLPFRVIGLLVPKGASAAMGQDQDDTIMVPLTTCQKKMTGHTWLQWIMVSAKSKDMSYTAQQQITSLLRDRHRIKAGDDDDFFVRNLADMADLADQQSRVMTILLASIAGVSLLVGGIGIMNIMLVSVTERTREIGILKALGATRRDILVQFLLEAALLALLGGVIGIVLGYAAGAGIAMMIPNFPPASVPLWVVLVAAGFSALVGVVFGLMPASKAAGLDPIEALRYE